MMKSLYYSCLFITVLSLGSCQKSTDETDDAEYFTTVAYVAGYEHYRGMKLNETGTVTAAMYVLISENLVDTLLTIDVPENIMTFPLELLLFPPGGYLVGYVLFPNEYRFTYKMQLTYRMMTQEEILENRMFPLIPAIFYNISTFSNLPKCIIIKSIKKIN